jgi:hypothetical protein
LKIKIQEGKKMTGTSENFITAKEIMTVLDVSQTKAYSIAKKLNQELSDKGYMVIPGRVSRKYFEERFYGMSTQ